MINKKLIVIHEDTVKALDKLRTHPRETWDDLIQKLIKKIEEKN